MSIFNGALWGNFEQMLWNPLWYSLQLSVLCCRHVEDLYQFHQDRLIGIITYKIAWNVDYLASVKYFKMLSFELSFFMMTLTACWVRVRFESCFDVPVFINVAIVTTAHDNSCNVRKKMKNEEDTEVIKYYYYKEINIPRACELSRYR